MLFRSVLTVVPSAVRAQATTTTTAVEAIRSKLLRLPYYGVFDFLAFSYANGVVTLRGFAYRPTLASDAERAVKRVEGVREVSNQIEVLPVGAFDDDLRWRVYYTVYRDPFLSRYAPGGGLLWGHRHPFAGGQLRAFGGRFPDSEPAGDYPIHIVVKDGHVLLLGVVDSDDDRQRAGMLARTVSGSFTVENELTIEPRKKQSS